MVTAVGDTNFGSPGGAAGRSMKLLGVGTQSGVVGDSTLIVVARLQRDVSVERQTRGRLADEDPNGDLG